MGARVVWLSDVAVRGGDCDSSLGDSEGSILTDEVAGAGLGLPDMVVIGGSDGPSSNEVACGDVMACAARMARE